MAASVFLAPALRHAARRPYPRDPVCCSSCPRRLTVPYELAATALGLPARCLPAAWRAAGFVHESFAYDEVAQGTLRVPLWIPQICMPIGLALLTLMLARRLAMVARGRQPEETAHG